MLFSNWEAKVKKYLKEANFLFRDKLWTNPSFNLYRTYEKRSSPPPRPRSAICLGGSLLLQRVVLHLASKAFREHETIQDLSSNSRKRSIDHSTCAQRANWCPLSKSWTAREKVFFSRPGLSFKEPLTNRRDQRAFLIVKYRQCQM